MPNQVHYLYRTQTPSVERRWKGFGKTVVHHKSFFIFSTVQQALLRDRDHHLNVPSAYSISSNRNTVVNRTALPWQTIKPTPLLTTPLSHKTLRARRIWMKHVWGTIKRPLKVLRYRLCCQSLSDTECSINWPINRFREECWGSYCKHIQASSEGSFTSERVSEAGSGSVTITRSGSKLTRKSDPSPSLVD